MKCADKDPLAESEIWMKITDQGNFHIRPSQVYLWTKTTYLQGPLLSGSRADFVDRFSSASFKLYQMPVLKYTKNTEYMGVQNYG